MFARGSCLLLVAAALPFLLDADTGQQSSDKKTASSYKSPLGLALTEDGSRAFVALNTTGTLAVVDLRQGRVIAEIAVGNRPNDVALAGDSLFVTCEADSTLVKVDTKKLQVTEKWKTDKGPRGVAVFEDGSRAFVACHDAKTLWTLDTKSKKTASLKIPGWPERVIVHRDSDYRYLLVLSQEPGTGLVSLVDSKMPLRMLHTNRLGNITNPRGIVSKPGPSSFVLMVHQRPRTRVPATQIAQGWVFTNAVSSFSPWGVDTPPKARPRGKVLDNRVRSFADPSDVVLAGDHHAFVSCAGADTVLMLRTDKFVDANYGPIAYDEKTAHLLSKDDLSLSRRYVVGEIDTQSNPRRLALSRNGKTLVASNYLSDSLTVVDARNGRLVKHVSLGGLEPDAARRGEILFNSNELTHRGQFTCASCHPNGATDGLTWDLPRDGLGNFHNTRSLLGVKDTGPYGWLSTSVTLEDRIAGTLRTLHQHEPGKRELLDLVAYLKTLPAPSASSIPSDSASILLGKKLFENKARCAGCHSAPSFQDSEVHNVGTQVVGDPQASFDTPSLRGISRSAPYLHHGKAKTVQEVFTKYNNNERHGRAHTLDEDELRDLLAYLMSL